jgi:osmotically-inducible protein OsmY
MDPPVIPSDDLQGVEMAAGFASSIEDDEIDVDDLPESVDEIDSDVETDIRKALRFNSETTHLDDVRVYVRNGIAYLRGTVIDEDNISLVEEFVRDLDAVDDIRNELETADY